MCGILVWVNRSDTDLLGEDNQEETRSLAWLVRRGPDHQGCVHWSTTTSDMKSKICITLQASVLSMRKDLAPQPVNLSSQLLLLPKSKNEGQQDDKDDGVQPFYLCLNGEVYQSCTPSPNRNQDNDKKNEDNTMIESTVGDSAVSDTNFVANLVLQHVLAKTNGNYGDVEKIMSALGAVLSQLVNAEFAICLATQNWIFYAKDPWGRRSLLTGTDQHGNTHASWTLSSVATNNTGIWNEVPPGIIFAYHVLDGTTRQLAYHAPRHHGLVDNEAILSRDPYETLYILLRSAVRRRIAGKDNVAVLFSGGLDSVVLAALVLQESNRVTLANVCFVPTETEALPGESSTAADTRAAVASWHELQELFPNATISFAHRQVAWDTVQAKRTRLQQLIFPKTTVMDLNIATAFWFAADTVLDDDTRVLLTGLGADEQMGGYGRHRKAWQRGGEMELRQELRMDQQRLWERNLGRDDRVLSDTSKEARYPYLDSAVVHFLEQLQLDQICNFNLPPGQGDKYILRQVAGKLGLESARVAVKRAIQFGSRIAHVSDKKMFGSRRKATGDACFERD